MIFIITSSIHIVIDQHPQKDFNYNTIGISISESICEVSNIFVITKN